MLRTLTYTIQPNSKYAGKQIGEILRNHYHMSVGLIAHLKRTTDGILLNGRKRYVNYPVAPGDRLTLNIREEGSTVVPIDTPIDIVFENEDFLVVNKAANMTTYPCTNDDTTSVAGGLQHYFMQRGVEGRFHAVNRLDRDTTGLMLVAKNRYAHAMAAKQLHAGFGVKNEGLVRRYKCIVVGELTEQNGIIDAPIGRCDDSILKHCIRPDGKRAVTEYHTLCSAGGYSLVEVLLHTGRTHQIRLHFSHLGHPLLGDWLYGVENRALFQRPALHSYYLSFFDSLLGHTLEFESQLPDDMAQFAHHLHLLGT